MEVVARTLRSLQIDNPDRELQAWFPQCGCGCVPLTEPKKNIPNMSLVEKVLAQSTWRHS